MREHLIGFIKALQEKASADPECRVLLGLAGLGSERAGIRFGSAGYFDSGMVFWHGKNSTDDADDDQNEEMAVEAAADRFLKHYGLE